MRPCAGLSAFRVAVCGGAKNMSDIIQIMSDIF